MALAWIGAVTLYAIGALMFSGTAGRPDELRDGRGWLLCGLWPFCVLWCVALRLLDR
jgi:hypothetical protein